MRGRIATAAVLVVSLVLAVPGCGGKLKTIPVSGVVTSNHKPVKDAVVMFSPAAGGRPAIGKTDANGTFRLKTIRSGDGAIPGEHAVTITAFVSLAPDTTSELVDDRSAAQQKVQWIVPQKYSSRETSGLKASVTPEKHEFNFDL